MNGSCEQQKLRKQTDMCMVQDIDTLATFNDKQEEIANAAIYVKGNTIEWVGQTQDVPDKYKHADQVISLKDRIVIPGLVSTPLSVSLSQMLLQSRMKYLQ